MKYTLKTKTCIICYKDFTAKIYKHFETQVCSEHCSKVRNYLMRSNVIYVQCDYCDKLIVGTIKFINKKRYRFCSSQCDVNFRRNVKPVSESKRKDIYKRKYYGKNWTIISNKIRDNQNYKCADCNISEKLYGKNLSIHHIIPFVYFDTTKEANQLSNLVAICEPCHRKRHSGHNHPSNFDKTRFGKNYYKSGNTGKRVHDKDVARKIYEYLVSTNLSLMDISEKCDVSYGTVLRIYRGQRWTSLYDKPAYITNPRPKSKYYNNIV